ncbi:hypothetical protein SAMN05444412_102385 [Rhodonellum ikkaensis]|uniref:Uncharacterized protein n=1 Tax=Rhodonellum ikkaensis TaxID=336829 RepID=A0A1H3M8D2_9BACT|nr:hypothetical protein SAMN05444412_102385 [Rhodonellum ikkaensis]
MYLFVFLSLLRINIILEYSRRENPKTEFHLSPSIYSETCIGFHNGLESEICIRFHNETDTGRKSDYWETNS